jgi:hypothetical protein
MTDEKLRKARIRRAVTGAEMRAVKGTAQLSVVFDDVQIRSTLQAIAMWITNEIRKIATNA